jgi:hypothetical protein
MIDFISLAREMYLTLFLDYPQACCTGALPRFTLVFRKMLNDSKSLKIQARNYFRRTINIAPFRAIIATFSPFSTVSSASASQYSPEKRT